MIIRDACIASSFGILGYTSAACADPCSNVGVFGSFDESGLRESDYGIYAAGTFRIADEKDESKQSAFNLAIINCEKQRDNMGRVSLECAVTSADVTPSSDQCLLNLDLWTFSMKELQRGILTGMEDATYCFNKILTTDRNTQRVYLSFMRSQSANTKRPSPASVVSSLPRKC
jgi:hypothetical protein